MNAGKIQFITDLRPELDLVAQAELVCSSGIDWLQFRLKEVVGEEKLLIGREIAEICRNHGTLFIVNDDMELAAELGADGVHLGLDDGDPQKARELLGESAIVGGTCNSFDDIMLRHRQEVDYIGLGPYRFTSTKKNLSPVLGLQGYHAVLQKCRENNIEIPIVAIGGIRVEDIASLIAAGVYGIALSSLILDASEPTERIAAIKEQFLTE